jgi:formate dehydrogenase accessory protein FdhE
VIATASRTTVHGARRARARELASRYEYAREPLGLFAAVVDAQERAFDQAVRDRPSAGELVAYVVRVALPGVMEAAVSAGPEALREAALLRFHAGDLEGMVERWLSGASQDGTDAFLARASASPVLEALPELAAALRQDDASPRSCPRCGGFPQVAVFGDSGEALLTSQRTAVCARCAHEWTLSRMTCASCGETAGAAMPILSDVDALPHLRVDACDTCRSYLVTVDVRKEPRAVPIVDELIAIPLDMLAAERGYAKIALNLLGL